MQPVARRYGAPSAGRTPAAGRSQPRSQEEQDRPHRLAAVVTSWLVIGGVIGTVSLGGDDDNRDDRRRADDREHRSDDRRRRRSPTSAVRFEGLGYELQVPTGWTDGTEEFAPRTPALATLDKVLLWGETFNSARGNVIVETQSSYGYTDPNDLKETWKQALASATTAADVDGANVAIDGQTALASTSCRTNAAA